MDKLVKVKFEYKTDTKIFERDAYLIWNSDFIEDTRLNKPLNEENLLEVLSDKFTGGHYNERYKIISFEEVCGFTNLIDVYEVMCLGNAYGVHHTSVYGRHNVVIFKDDENKELVGKIIEVRFGSKYQPTYYISTEGLSYVKTEVSQDKITEYK